MPAHILHDEADLTESLAELLAADPRLQQVLDRCGRPPLRRRPAGFPGLCAIVCARRGRWRDMLRTNLSTRPFYNERGVHLLLLLVALIVGGVTLANVYELLQLSRQNTELSTNVNRDRAEADRLTRDAARIRRGINPDELQLVVDAAREANVLIDQALKAARARAR